MCIRDRDRTKEPDYDLPSMLLGEHIVEDYRTIGLSLKMHPTALLRDELRARGAIRAEQLKDIPNGAFIFEQAIQMQEHFMEGDLQQTDWEQPTTNNDDLDADKITF